MIQMDSNIAYFKKGILVDVYPRTPSISLYDDREIAYHAITIISDSRKYNLLDPRSVASIPCPHFATNDGSVTLSLDYILRMCASYIRNSGYNEQSILVLWKAVQLMPHSGVGWLENDYLRLSVWLYEDGRIAEGDRVQQYVRNDKAIQFEANTQNVAMRNFQDASRNGLISYNNYSGVCCEICSIYSGRVYRTSWTWATRKFPNCRHFCPNVGVGTYVATQAFPHSCPDGMIPFITEASGSN